MKLKVEKEEKQRLDIFLTNYFEKFSRKEVNSLIENEFILVNDKIQKNSYKLKLNDIITFDEDKISFYFEDKKTLKPLNINIDIKYEDDDVIVINKPKNLLTHPTKFEKENTLANFLLYHCKNIVNKDTIRPGIVHRLDKNTSGLMIAAKTDLAYESLTSQIKDKTLKRKYLAIALGNFENKEDTIEKPLLHYMKDNVKMMVSSNGIEAVTKYKVLEEYTGASLVELELKTGRTHQIRVHLSSINHPVFGDSLYGAKSFMRNEFYNLKTQEQLLQSYYISFQHPKTDETMEFQLKQEDFSEDFNKVLNFLRSKNNAH